MCYWLIRKCRNCQTAPRNLRMRKASRPSESSWPGLQTIASSLWLISNESCKCGHVVHTSDSTPMNDTTAFVTCQHASAWLLSLPTEFLMPCLSLLLRLFPWSCVETTSSLSEAAFCSEWERHCPAPPYAQGEPTLSEQTPALTSRELLGPLCVLP